jgi:hypothetical protein
MKYLFPLILFGCQTFQEAKMTCVDDLLAKDDSISKSTKFVCSHSRDFGLCFQSVSAEQRTFVFNCIQDEME